MKLRDEMLGNKEESSAHGVVWNTAAQIPGVSDDGVEQRLAATLEDGLPAVSAFHYIVWHQWSAV